MIIILAAGTLHIYGFLTTDQGVFDATPYALATLAGVGCLIIGLAVFEKFGWAGGFIMGPIETFGLLANTLSYLRVMGVGVAGVKIAEVSITMGWDLMWSGGGVVSIVLGLVLFVFIQAFALASDRSRRASTLPVSLRGMDGQVLRRLRSGFYPDWRSHPPHGGAIIVPWTTNWR